MRALTFTLAIGMIGTPALLWAGDNDADKGKLQGTWTCVALIDKGKAEPVERVARLKLIIKNDKYSYQIDDKLTFTATFKLDAAAKPRAIDVKFDDGPLKGKTMFSIYAFEGDELKICGGDKRPSEFTSTAESGTVLFTFKREKK